ncbi:MAG TPA: alpha/beta fold hydrolase [Xanthobacteraceae bacterium]|nr:alpha/beta fold hydrolase [Xanthobacteraceae bacterium]
MAAGIMIASTSAPAQEWQNRTWPELKAETQARADRGAYPVFSIKSEDARDALAKIDSLDPDQWGTAWMQIGDRYFDRAEKEEASNRAAATADYLSAWRLYSLGRWPLANSPKKQESGRKATLAFERYGRLAEPKIETITVPFEGKEIHAFLERPAGIAKPPVVLSIAGTDLFHDYTAIVTRSFLPAGVASVTLDMPGTGDSPVAARPGAERVFSRLIDYLKTRPDLDGTRIVVRGESWGSYWAARVAYAEPTRIRGTVLQSGPVHNYFQRDWQKTAFKTKEFLFDYVPSRLHMLGVTSVEQAFDLMPTLSLETEGLLDKPTAPMLVIGGYLDSQVPFADTMLLLTHGSPKSAWINPKGMTMGRSVTIKDQWIFDNVIVPWVKDQVERPAAQ